MQQLLLRHRLLLLRTLRLPQRTQHRALRLLQATRLRLQYLQLRTLLLLRLLLLRARASKQSQRPSFRLFS
jgi:hypothetical protein